MRGQMRGVTIVLLYDRPMSMVTTSPLSTISRPPTTVWRAEVGAQNTMAATGSLKPPL